MRTHKVEGGGGLKLHVAETGPADAPAILFLHGWSQSHLCWSKQFDSTLAEEFRLVAIDLRGHGDSEAPLEPECYSDGALWADDVRNVVDALTLDRPVVVAWSYGGFVLSDYLRVYGDDGIAGINFVGAAVVSGKPWFGSHIGADFLKYAPLAFTEDETAARQAISDFLDACFAIPVSAEDKARALDWNMRVHPRVRQSLLRRTVDFTPELAKLSKPTLVSYGDCDTIMMPAMAHLIGETAPTSRLSEYSGVGHLPFMEEPARFNEELAAFGRRCSEGK